MSTTIEDVAVSFDSDSRNWTANHDEINEIFLRSVQNWMLDRLKMRGHLFVNEVLDELGLPRQKRGQLVGWIYRDDVAELWSIAKADEKSVDLVFRTDGEILDLIEDWA